MYGLGGRERKSDLRKLTGMTTKLHEERSWGVRRSREDVSTNPRQARLDHTMPAPCILPFRQCRVSARDSVADKTETHTIIDRSVVFENHFVIESSKMSLTGAAASGQNGNRNGAVFWVLVADPRVDSRSRCSFMTAIRTARVEARSALSFAGHCALAGRASCNSRFQ